MTRLGYGQRVAMLDALRSRTGSEYASEKLARAAVQEILVSANGDKPATLVKAVTESLAVRDPEAPIVSDRSGSPKPDPDLRDHENVPLPKVSVAFEPDPTVRLETTEYRTAVDDYLAAEVHPYVPDAWPDPDKTKIGYEIPLTRHFYTYAPPRSLDEINSEIRLLEADIQFLINEMT